MTDPARKAPQKRKIPADPQARRADILRIGNRAAAAVQAANRERGIPNGYSLRGRLVSDAPSAAGRAEEAPLPVGRQER